MKTILRKVYYCDFCKKHSFRRLTKHEKYCTGNPDRECRMCGDPVNVREAVSKIPVVEEKDDTMGWLNVLVNLADIKKLTTCPACILAVLIAIRAAHSGAYVLVKPRFDYKAEHEAWWKMVNENQEG